MLAAFASGAAMAAPEEVAEGQTVTHEADYTYSTGLRNSGTINVGTLSGS